MQQPPQLPSQPLQENPAYPQQPVQPGMYPQMPPQQPAPRKKHTGRTLLIVGIVALVVLAACIGALMLITNASKSQNTGTASNTQSSSQASSSQPTSAPTSPSKATTWTTTHTYKGSGIKKTEVFTVGDDWKILWSCDPTSFYGGQYNVVVNVYSPDGTLQDVAINDMCKQGNTSGSTEEHSGGQVYLEIDSEGSWTIQIQELK